MSSVGPLVQGVYLIAVGIAFGVCGVITLQDPIYWEPVTGLDHAAVWTYSLALLLAGPALVILARQARAGRAASYLAWIMAGAAVIAAVANAIEDGFDQEGFGVLYIAGSLPFVFGQVVLAIMLGVGDRKAFALVPTLTFLGLVAFNSGGGILIGLTWAAFGLLVLVGRTTPTSIAVGLDDARLNHP
jgi:hypothetical protein